MIILLNNKETHIPEACSLQDLLKLKKYKRSAVIINDIHILIRDYNRIILKKDDVVKIVRMSGGG